MTKASDAKKAEEAAKVPAKTAAEAQAERDAAAKKDADADKAKTTDKADDAKGATDAKDKADETGKDDTAAAEAADAAAAPVEPQPTNFVDPNPQSVAQGVNTAPDVPDAATPSTTLPDDATAELAEALGDETDDEDLDDEDGAAKPVPPTTEFLTANELAKPSTQTADQLVGSVGIDPNAVEGHVAKRIATLASRDAVSPVSNLYDDLGFSHGDIHELTKLLNEDFGIHILPTERDNFLLVRDVYNMVKRKLGQ